MGMLLIGASVTRAASLCGVLRATVSGVMLAYHHEGRTTSNKNNCNQIKSMYYRTSCTQVY